MENCTSRVLVGWKAVAAYLGYAVKTAKRYAATNGLPVSRYSGRIRTLPEDLDAWIRRGVAAAARREPRASAKKKRRHRDAWDFVLNGRLGKRSQTGGIRMGLCVKAASDNTVSVELNT